jgi:hypothetical protein
VRRRVGSVGIVSTSLTDGVVVEVALAAGQGGVAGRTSLVELKLAVRVGVGALALALTAGEVLVGGTELKCQLGPCQRALSRLCDRGEWQTYDTANTARRLARSALRGVVVDSAAKSALS